MICVLLYKTWDEPPVATYLETGEDGEFSLPELQKLVDGYIEAVYPFCGQNKPALTLICNEEGKLRNMAPNRYVPAMQDVICGPFFVTNTDFTRGVSFDLTSNDIAFCGEHILDLRRTSKNA